MSAGQTVTLQWRPVEPEGREGRVIAIQFQYMGDDLRRRSHALETVLEGPQVVSDALLPPGKETALTLPSTLELLTVVLGEAVDGELRLRRRGGTTRLLPPAQEGVEDWPLRLYLDVRERRP